MNRRNAFTLIEMIVVVGVIVMLASILLPVLNTAREQARAVRCQNNLHTLWQGYVAFAESHDNRLPGGYYDAANPNPDRRDWMLGAQVTNYLAGPQEGTLFKYVNRAYDVYRCPSLDLAAAGPDGPGGGSNGRFDYSAFLYVTGCRLDRLPLRATVTDPVSGDTLPVPAPVIVEEESAHMNGDHQMEAAHSNTDTLGNQHHGGSFFTGTDGSVQWIGPPWINFSATSWTAVSVRGNTVNLGTTGITWSWYERQ